MSLLSWGSIFGIGGIDVEVVVVVEVVDGIGIGYLRDALAILVMTSAAVFNRNSAVTKTHQIAKTYDYITFKNYICLEVRKNVTYFELH